MPPRARRATLLVAVGLFAAACQQVVPPGAPPPGSPPPAGGTEVGTQNACDPASHGQDTTPTAAAPVEYAARVDEPGPGQEEIVTFTATSEGERDAKVAALDAKGEIVAFAPNRPVSAEVNPDDAFFAEQYGLHAAHADFEGAWANGYDGSGVVIAVVDSGVKATHEDLATQVNALGGADFVMGSGNGTSDGNGHGTHVAGIAAAADSVFPANVGGLGGAPGANILPVRVLNNSASGFDSDVAEGIDYAVANGADVINLSLGAASCLEMTQQAVHDALAAGVVVVAAGGNCGSTGTSGCPTADAAIYPAAGPDTDLIAVGATDDTNERAAFSNFNPHRRVPLTWPKPASYIDLAAPGVAIKSTYIPATNSYAVLSGTSMATPHVAAAAALIIQRCMYSGPGTPAKVKAMLEATADPSSTTTASGDLGAGLIKVGAATAATQPCL